MTRAQEIRHECLLQLFGSQSIPISAAHIRKVAKRQGETFTDTEINDALYFLKGQGFCESVRDDATGEVRHRITSKGTLHWEETNS